MQTIIVCWLTTLKFSFYTSANKTCRRSNRSYNLFNPPPPDHLIWSTRYLDYFLSFLSLKFSIISCCMNCILFDFENCANFWLILWLCFARPTCLLLDSCHLCKRLIAWQFWRSDVIKSCALHTSWPSSRLQHVTTVMWSNKLRDSSFRGRSFCLNCGCQSNCDLQSSRSQGWRYVMKLSPGSWMQERVRYTGLWHHKTLETGSWRHMGAPEVGNGVRMTWITSESPGWYLTWWTTPGWRSGLGCMVVSCPLHPSTLSCSWRVRKTK